MSAIRLATSSSPGLDETARTPLISTRQPPAPLAGMVECLWWCPPSRGSGSVAHRVLPDGCMDLILRVRRDGHGSPHEADLFVTGAARRFSVIPLDPADSFIGVRFRPGWGGPMLGVAAGELSDGPVAADMASPRLLRDLPERLAQASDTVGGLAVLERFLLNRSVDSAAGASRTSALLATAIRLSCGPDGSIASCAQAAGISARSLRRHFQEAVGLSPKRFARIQRMQHALRLADAAALRREWAGWADVALAAGYADQAHMIRDFKDLTGLAPASLVAERRALAALGIAR